jgi:hypothetical protein
LTRGGKEEKSGFNRRNVTARIQENEAGHAFSIRVPGCVKWLSQDGAPQTRRIFELFHMGGRCRFTSNPLKSARFDFPSSSPAKTGRFGVG